MVNHPRWIVSLCGKWVSIHWRQFRIDVLSICFFFFLFFLHWYFFLSHWNWNLSNHQPWIFSIKWFLANIIPSSICYVAHVNEISKINNDADHAPTMIFNADSIYNRIFGDGISHWKRTYFIKHKMKTIHTVYDKAAGKIRCKIHVQNIKTLFYIWKL